jgi:hypothetical protein
MTPAELFTDREQQQTVATEQQASDPNAGLEAGAAVRYHLDRDTTVDAAVMEQINDLQYDLHLSDGRTRLGVRRGYGSRQPGTFDTLAEVEFANTRGQRRTPETTTPTAVTNVAPDGTTSEMSREQVARTKQAHERSASAEGGQSTANRDQTSPPMSVEFGPEPSSGTHDQTSPEAKNLDQPGITKQEATEGHGLASNVTDEHPAKRIAKEERDKKASEKAADKPADKPTDKSAKKE